MKKTLQFGSLALAIAMLASPCACNSRDEPQSSNELLTSAPTQVSAEEPTVFATEETEPPTEALADMTEETESYAVNDEDFEIYKEDEFERLYHYIGHSQTVTIRDVGLEIELPEEWAGRVEVVRNARPEYMELFIGNIRLMEAYADMGPGQEEIERGYGWYDWVLLVQAVRKDNTATIEALDQSENRIYLGENDEYRFYFATADMHGEDSFLTARTIMIHNQGQEYYDDLVGDLVCTVEQAKEMLKVI